MIEDSAGEARFSSNGRAEFQDDPPGRRTRFRNRADHHFAFGGSEYLPHIGHTELVICQGMSLSEQTFDPPSPKMENAKRITHEDLTMIKPSTKDEVEGNLHDLKEKVKEKTGEAVNDPNLEAEGQAEKIAGKIQKKVGQVEKVLGG